MLGMTITSLKTQQRVVYPCDITFDWVNPKATLSTTVTRIDLRTAMVDNAVQGNRSIDDTVFVVSADSGAIATPFDIHYALVQPANITTLTGAITGSAGAYVVPVASVSGWTQGMRIGVYAASGGAVKIQGKVTGITYTSVADQGGAGSLTVKEIASGYAAAGAANDLVGGWWSYGKNAAGTSIIDSTPCFLTNSQCQVRVKPSSNTPILLLWSNIGGSVVVSQGA